ncbi:peptide methionine sulfoxide reductase MsrA [Leminorella grimontii]|uniref:Peptide methionine sulfoxide reductase MsrA n=1 Tax=Leminorella grimontii TaxID=82981 RepID=A0AAV5N3I7_9GAMM|nr:peptide-methionine (S)-S-oxide reductase MsrA [Leminorella grimontii]KFC94556.1 peptide methionine sulfoxide reductase [Leminorella grimontii ATCC 33999 = DSM 5078]GKX56651.1 peptide methionine sulfoxide reductase MsrA [Leminorella grimontii]VFS61887.1 Peptide methionine sulfoxide reductase MsrA [Leminorella grimontii]
MTTVNSDAFTQPENPLEGRSQPMPVSAKHRVLHTPMKDAPDGTDVAIFAMGCFWGVERLFWQQHGVYSTAAGYSGGVTPNPNYREVCSGKTGHAEVVKVVFDPKVLPYSRLLQLFWENHDPAQGMRQGNDIGTQYRSAIYAVTQEQLEQARASRAAFISAMRKEGDLRSVTTEIVMAKPFYFAEEDHQQYLDKNPNGYCNLGGIGVCLPPAP